MLADIACAHVNIRLVHYNGFSFWQKTSFRVKLYRHVYCHTLGWNHMSNMDYIVQNNTYSHTSSMCECQLLLTSQWHLVKLIVVSAKCLNLQECCTALFRLEKYCINQVSLCDFLLYNCLSTGKSQRKRTSLPATALWESTRLHNHQSGQFNSWKLPKEVMFLMRKKICLGLFS